MRLPLDPPFRAAWDPVPRRAFDATLVRVETDAGVTGYGSGDTMDGFAPFSGLFVAAGFRAVKVRIDRTAPALALDAVRAVREVVGPDIGRWFTPHTWTNGLGLLANLHVVCGVGGGPWVEFPWDPPGWTAERRDFF